MTEISTQSNYETPRNISVIVIDLLILIGLISEFLGLMFIIKEKKIITESILANTIMVCMGFMLIHHFFIIKNFHRIDHMSKEQLINNGFGNWVIKSRFEDLIRVIIFGLFACLTGEIVYLIIIYNKNVDLMNSTYYYLNPITKILEPKTYDLTWITEFYINSAFYMSLLMFIWDIFGRFYDKVWKPLSENEKRKPENIANQIVAFPFNDPFWIFLISDGIALCMWWFLKGLIVEHNENSKFGLTILFVIYAIVILVRLVGSAIAYWPKLRAILRYWRSITFKKLLDEF
jgi:hypothetical protein